MIRTNARSTRPLSLALPMLLLLPIALALLAGCGSDNPPTAPKAPRFEVLVLSDGGSQDSMIAILRRDGLSVVAGPNFKTYNVQDIARYAAVVLPVGVEYSQAVPDSLVPSYVQYVANGGGLVTTDWMAYYRSTYWQRFSPLLASVRAGSYLQGVAENYSVAISHRITEGLPSTFAIPATSSYGFTARDMDAGKNTRVIINGSRSGAVVVEGTVGLGRIVHWNIAGAYNGANPWNANTRRLFANMVRHAGGL